MDAQPKLPKNWPPNLPYLSHPSHSPALSPSHLSALKTPPKSEPPLPTIPKSLNPGPSPNVLILPISDPSHPANGQHGLFAARDLAPGELIVVYLGEVHPAGDPRHETSDYDLWLDREVDVAVDACDMGNEGRFVNDYRGVPDFGATSYSGGGGGRGKNGKGKGGWKDKEGKRRGPNAEFREVWDGRFGERGMGVFVLPVRKRAVGRERVVGIGRREEVLVSYGKGFWEGRTEGDGDGKVEEGVGVEVEEGES
ncbi:hypothetical protein B0T16DRAFT_418595 [Cercophora newfieldiana]|uniref:SET domain-containing protein n=1 Tax=Cercophora newfieldiana TaxID=92897 RepID=A0AA39XVH2_9PEZI|nr:hypothetical protein B0T16DRAFT_418595 [Cercophora newfieldiana]